MKKSVLERLQNGKLCDLLCGFSRAGMTVAQVLLLILGPTVATGQAQDEDGMQVLTRGPVHEAFAGMVSFNPEAGVIVEEAPPESISELPPEDRPVGDNIAWIPGYWAWDDERTDFLWVSGIWRALPPGREWTTGYWATRSSGNQWISGYWADSSVEETTYLPKPPVTVEAGPNIAAPSRNHHWRPGSWTWRQESYAWRPGYWAEGRADWDWIPASHVWTPRGYVFVDGYWDHSFARRGALYAPVYFQAGYRSRPNYTYSPIITIGLVAVAEHLFLRPNYHHYYFGDYYDRRYRSGGFYSPNAYQSSRYGYDPVYVHRRWKHREDRDWERRDKESYDYRRDHPSARPPRTWADQMRLKNDSVEVTKHRQMMAGPLDQVAKREQSSMRLQTVSKKEKEGLANRSRELRRIREQRKSLESGGADRMARKTDGEIRPTRVKLPKSPIVGKNPAKLTGAQTPPKRQQEPATNERGTRKPEGQKDSEKTRSEPKRQRETRHSAAKKEQPMRERKEAAARLGKEQPNPRRENAASTPKKQAEPARREEKPARQQSPSKVKKPELKIEQKSRRAEQNAPVKPSQPSKAKGTGKNDKETPDPSGGKDRRKER